MNKSLLRIMLISISLCWILSAKTHIDDQVDPSVVEKMAVEVQKANEALEANELINQFHIIQPHVVK